MYFIRYNLIGILNTLIHWLMYLTLTLYLYLESIYANFISFFISSTFSYILNSKINYKVAVKKSSYLKFIIIIGFLSIIISGIFSYLNISNIFMLIFYTFTNVFLGYFFTKKMVFKK